MSGNNSLNQYKNTLLTSGQPANNFNRPNLDYRNGGRLESTNWNTIKTTTPSVQWNKYYTKDPILNFGSTSSSLDGGGFLETMSNIASGITFVGGAAMTAMGIFSAVKAIKGSNNASEGTFSRKESKTISENTTASQDAMNALDSSITTAEEVLNSSNDPDTIQKAHENLMSSITNAQQTRNDAANKKETATNTKDNLEKKKLGYENQINDLKNEKTKLTNQLNELKGQDTSQMSAEEKSAHNKKIADLEQQIKTKEKEIEKVQKEIDNYVEQISVQQQIIDNNSIIMTELEANIKTGTALSSKLAAKTGVDK